MQPIETFYNGFRFRSRLEARWACFFDAMAWDYHYEPQGFLLPEGLPYLPDFFLPRFNAYIEIKGQAPSEEEQHIARQCGSSAQPYCLLYGPCAGGGVHGVYLVTSYIEESPQAYFAGCRSCHQGIWIRGVDFATPLEPCPDPCWCDKWPLPTKQIAAAYAHAQQARFEHGETPQGRQRSS
jgi:hypothetical protein